MPGYTHPDFAPLRTVLERVCLPTSGPGGMAVAVYHRGEKVVDYAAGTRDRAEQPFTPETLGMAMSTSKAVIATLVHVLVDEGVLNYDWPIARWWPAFARHGKGGITLRHMLSHQAGLYAVADMIEDAEQLLDWDHMVGAVEGAKPRHLPGESYGYHGWTMGFVLGELIQRASGLSLATALHEKLAAPLGIDSLYIGLPHHENARAAEVILPALAQADVSRRSVAKTFSAVDLGLQALGLRTRLTQSLAAAWPRGLLDLDFNSEAFRGATIPSVNGMYTADTLARLFAPLATGGEHAGTRLLSAKTLELATQDQSSGVCLIVPFPLRYKLGYMRPISLGLPIQVLGKRRDLGIASPNAFGHFGFGGSGAWADPDRALSVGVVANSFMGKLPIDVRTVALCTAAAYCASRR